MTIKTRRMIAFAGIWVGLGVVTFVALMLALGLIHRPLLAISADVTTVIAIAAFRYYLNRTAGPDQ